MLDTPCHITNYGKLREECNCFQFDPLLSIRNREKMAAMQQRQEEGENLVEALLKTTLADSQED